MIASPSVHVIGDDFDPTPEDRFMVWATSFGNVFLTGQAGTGKSTLLREFLSRVEGVRDVAVTAPTGIAALNVGGTTVHRWCGMQLGPRMARTSCRLLRGWRATRQCMAPASGCGPPRC